MDTIRPNRSRRCNVCRRDKYRVLLPAPKADDPDYTVAVCPECDKTTGNRRS